ncbi:lipase domain protein [Fibrobacter succinogenes subsp. succinogenes S85]|uniref:Esterase/lipase/thioesterase n=1 Tax=Fibrobacter succinogenes (strain ATCC 19169 / S85) TaxID=59374 RepID=C9RRC5_FIBSS|nr:alpha/beta hydrolase [Fibrobacter succinogenes]ACX75111.1 putative esterase/lipase/thioesterase [Fibrobacter succinogenes subsp. succinogenes S85]ADL26846.1 lipase domain protein [Fibrobacter succinogenes subsp. succinogenes S85]
MKSKLLKTVVLASSLVFLNCGDDVTSAINNYAAGFSSSSAEEVQPGTSSDSQGDAGTEISSSAAQQNQDAILPGSSADVGPQVESSSTVAPGAESSADVAASSSSVDAPASSSEKALVVSSSSVSAPAVSSSSSEEKVESSSSEEAKPKGVFLAEGSDETKDQMRVKYIERTGHDGGGILAYPEQLSNDQKHAVVVWGPGGGTEPGAYGGIIRRLASHGFVVIALRESPGNATQAIPALNWLEKKNKDPNDPLYQKLDMTKVGCSGHSMGGLESEQALIKDDRVITAMLNNSGDLGHTAMSQVSASKTVGIVYGEGGMERPNAEADYNNQGVKAPACLIKMTGGQGNECQQGECGWGHGSGPWGGMAATVAWMRWHLGGEDFRKADFVGTSGRYINGEIIGERGHWKGQCKNF